MLDLAYRDLRFPRLGRMRGGWPTLADFAAWFLSSGSIDVDGVWVDAAPFGETFFLASGRINVFGVWDDWQPFSDQSAQAGLFFLSSGAVSVAGIWSDAEVFA